jgi:hypothetical protein
MYDYAGVVARTDLIELVQKSGGNLKRVAGEWRGRCPLHLGDNRTAFSVYLESGKQKWKCFTHDCGQGDALDFTQKWLGISKDEAYLYLGGEKRLSTQEVAQLAAERAERAEKALQEAILAAQKSLDELRQAKKWLTYHSNLENNDGARQLWERRGIPQTWQDIWQLGYCPDFGYGSDGNFYHSPSLAIPIFDGCGDPCNIRHRLLEPIDQNDKYRPERSGLKAMPFICDPEAGWDLDHIMVVEGEIKAMVTYLTIDNSRLQVVGIPGKSSFNHIVDKIKDHKVIICLDPDAEAESIEFAKMVNGRILKLRGKIDDVILEGNLDKYSLRQILKNSQRPQ